MNVIPISTRATEFLDWIKQETGKQVNFDIRDDIGVNMVALYRPLASEIKIGISSELVKKKDLIDNLVCHEAAHGLLNHQQGYYFPYIISPLITEEKKLCSMALTMIDDLVVNKILADHGFPPFSDSYIKMVQSEIKALNEGEDIYKEHLDTGIIFYNKFKVYRYIMAWGFLKFYKLNATEEKIIYRYTKHFQRYLPECVADVTEITKLIEENDIFTVNGYLSVITGIFCQWGIGDKIRMEIYKF